MDDIGCFSNSWDNHLHLLNEVLQCLQSVGFTINPLKFEWAVKETDFLGYWLTPTGIKPWKKKIDIIFCLKPPSNIKELHVFLGMVNYYRDMWPCQTHTLVPLTVTEVWHMAHFWVSYGRCTMPGSPMGRSEGFSRRWTG